VVGTLRSLVIGYSAAAPSYVLSHVVVEPIGRIALGHLVPLRFAHAEEKMVHISCDRAAFQAFPMAETSRLVPGVESTHGIAGSWFSGIGMAANDIVPPGHIVLHSGAPVQTAGPGASLAGASVDRDNNDQVVDLLVWVRRHWRRRRLASVDAASIARNEP